MGVRLLRKLSCGCRKKDLVCIFSFLLQGTWYLELMAKSIAIQFCRGVGSAPLDFGG